MENPQNIGGEKSSSPNSRLLSRTVNLECQIMTGLKKVARDSFPIQMSSVSQQPLRGCTLLAARLCHLLDSTQDHSKFIGAFHSRQDFVDSVEVLYRAAMKGQHIVACPLPPERIPKFQLLYKDY